MKAVAKVILKKPKIACDHTCFLCFSSNQNDFVVNPSNNSYIVLSDSLTRLASINHDGALRVLFSIGGSCTSEKLQSLDVRWHLKCYKSFTHKKTVATAEGKFSSCMEIEDDSCRPTPSDDTSDSLPQIPHFTRSNAPHYDKGHCFFCDLPGNITNRLRHISYDSSGAALRSAVELSGNDVWRVRLSECITPHDGHAIDVLYHIRCWTANVIGVLRKTSSQPDAYTKSTSYVACDVEFVGLVDEFLSNGNVSTMAALHTTYLNVCTSNGFDIDATRLRSRKELKEFLKEEIPQIVFSSPKQRNSSERVSMAQTRDAAMWRLEEDSEEYQLQILSQAAKVIRKVCCSCDKWSFKGSLSCEESQLPEKLSVFFRWCLGGRARVGDKYTHTSKITERAKRLSQILMFECVSDRQSRYTGGYAIKRTRELPLQVGLGVTLHKEIRSAKVVNLLSMIGVSVNYDKVLEIESAMANAVVQRMAGNGGFYIPPDFKANRFTHFAADNLDFCEDTSDGRRTLHATVLVGYQSCEEGDVMEDLLQNVNEGVVHIPETIYRLLPCSLASNVKPLCRELPSHTELLNKESLSVSLISDLSWLLGRRYYFRKYKEVNAVCEAGLSWAAHNAVVIPSNGRKTNIAVFPILDTTPTNRSVQLTVNRYFQKVKEILGGPGSKTVITVDLGLYRPMQQLLMATNNKDSILMPGDLHIVMAQLRAIGTFIDMTGIPELWIESGLYSDTVCNRILEGKSVRRSIAAHVITLQVLVPLLLDAFFEAHPEEGRLCDSAAKNLSESWEADDKNAIKQEHFKLQDKLQILHIHEKLKVFCDTKSAVKGTFNCAIQYINMVLTMLSFIRAVRSSNWDLRLAALYEFGMYFFALDLRNYATMCSLHVAEMASLKSEDPET